LNAALPPAELATVVADTREWIERAVIGLDLCPFARAVYLANRIRYRVSAAHDEEALLADLADELSMLHATPEDTCETTLLIHPRVLSAFADYNVFLDTADARIDSLGLRGEIQIAAFIRATSSKPPHPMISATSPTGRRIRCCICFAKRASSARSRPSPTPPPFSSAISKRFAGWASMAGSGCSRGHDRNRPR
jgi:hypothetical protein